MTYQTIPHLSFSHPASTTTPAACCLSLREAGSDLLIREVLLLRDCIEVAKRRWAFEIQAAVILPNQFQMLGVFETGEFSIGKAVELIQQTFERHLPVSDMAIWDQHVGCTILDWSAVPLRTKFIEAAPVRARLVSDPRDWRYSTAYDPDREDGSFGQIEVA